MKKPELYETFSVPPGEGSVRSQISPASIERCWRLGVAITGLVMDRSRWVPVFGREESAAVG
jgi:hypothetical protein